jgi:hypothetical protein
VHETFLGLRRPHRDGQHLVGWVSFQGNGTRHPQTVKGVDLRRYTLPENGLRRIVKAYLCHDRDVFHANGKLHPLSFLCGGGMGRRCGCPALWPDAQPLRAWHRRAMSMAASSLVVTTAVLFS